jgi:hypothetical protein
MAYFAGLDVSVKETRVCIVDDAGKIVREARVASEPEALLQVLTIYRFKRVGLEAGPLSQWLYSVLAENDLRATLRNFGLKVGMIGTVKFETRIRELVENLPDLAVLVRLLSDGVASQPELPAEKLISLASSRLAFFIAPRWALSGRVRGSKRTSGGTSSAVFARWSKIAGPEATSRPCNQPLTLPELRPTFGRKLLDRERGSARHCGLDLLAHLSLGRSGTPLRGGGVLFRHAASLSGMSQLTACAISTSQGTRSGSGRGMRPSANALASSMRFWGKVQGAGRSPALVGQPSPLGSLLK